MRAIGAGLDAIAGIEVGDGAVAIVSSPGREPLARRPLGDDARVDLYDAVLPLAVELEARGVRLAGCLSCVQFRFSGMSRDMSGGAAGYCGLVGWRARRGVVSIDHGCGEHEPAPGWPGDDRAAFEAREARTVSQKNAPSRLAAFEGAMLGLAVGDALGFPAEFRTREQILASFGPAGLGDLVAVHDPAWPAKPMILGKPHPAGTVSDDTQMTIALAEGLLEAHDADLDARMTAVARRFCAWAESPDNDRAPGGTCLEGCARLAAGTAWRQAGVAASKGCGSAMRVAPIGLLYGKDLAAVLEVARASSLLTHGHDAAVEGAAAAALLVALALDKRTPKQMYEAVMQECAPRSQDLRRCFERLPALLAAPPEVALSRAGLGEGWVAEEAVASALYCLWREPDDYRRAVLLAANTTGDSDSIACIAGGVAGALHGAATIPAAWRERVEHAAALRELAGRLWAVAGGSDAPL